MNNKERAYYWQNNIVQWEASGLNGAQFCKQHELDLAQFYYWKSKFVSSPSKAVSGTKGSAGFAAVIVTDSPLVNESLNLTLPNGCAIVGINSGNVSLVRALLSQL